MSKRIVALGLAAAAALGVAPAGAEEKSGFFDWVHGDWYLTVGAAGFAAPEFEGASDMVFRATPMISLGKAGPEARFTSRNDNISLSFMDTGAFRAGAVGKIVFPRDSDDSDELDGLSDVKWGAELGAFAEFYPTDWLRVRGELRQGVFAHQGMAGDIAVDAFKDVTEAIRVSGGPRLSFASADYFETYYGVDAGESAASGLAEYDPGGGLKSAGVGGAITWKATEKVTASLFGEYARLLGPAADSSLVKERGSVDQFMVGLSTTYRFDFTVP
ncbi:MipA/OmpV family protein [Mesorhizobium sp. LHD-90]|uniref:MipA/OmpV family protein n=1 Tax=Mesorhizobium sp. LHD-90 TaxID=3071414 RepID=UPI0027E17A37|nr:MipA/OmpV family protein [Mesorhizobium sp. LHD-90]MDQ6435063.1 MipA/OmpV family protein [Mesorhizobium sp. LHD-90]